MDSFLIIFGILIFILIVFYVMLDMKELNKELSFFKNEMFEKINDLHKRDAFLNSQIERVESLITLLIPKPKKSIKKKRPQKRPRR